MYSEPYYGCAGGCANCPRRSRCMAWQAQTALDAAADTAAAALAAETAAQADAAADNDGAAAIGDTRPDAAEDATLSSFLQANPDEGTLRVQVFRGDQSIPVENVRVVISRRLGGQDHVFFQGSTNASGIIDPIVLPVPSRTLSLRPGEPHPYATYDLRAAHPQFQPLETTVDVYQGVKTVQPIQLRLRME